MGVAVLGGALLLWPRQETRGDRPAGAPAVPLWVERAPLKEELTRRLDPAPGGGEGAPAAADLLDELDRLLAALERPAGVLAAGRMQRTLGSGQVFEAALELDLTTSGGDGDGRFDLTVRHSPAAWSRYRGALRGRRVVDLEPVAVHGPEAPTFPVPARRDGAPGGDLASRVPLALGDVHLADLDGLAGALALGDLELLGELRAPGAEPLLVFDLRFPDRPAEGEVSEYSTRGATALLHVGALDRLPRALRVFDRAGRLVRTYSDLAFLAGGDSPWPVLRSFRVDSVASRSHTTVTVERFELTAP